MNTIQRFKIPTGQPTVQISIPAHGRILGLSMQYGIEDPNPPPHENDPYHVYMTMLVDSDDTETTMVTFLVRKIGEPIPEDLTLFRYVGSCGNPAPTAHGFTDHLWIFTQNFGVRLSDKLT